jgi:hypothetical protein
MLELKENDAEEESVGPCDCDDDKEDKDEDKVD